MTSTGRNTEPGKKSNRLIDEKSPYLLQHAYNPVDWFPWGDEAFEKARREDKPIFLSIGYSTCYWCHVMEREVFENESIAAIMNRTAVCIKVDREERPDIDRVYMSALQAMSGSGGWPMSMFLTHDLRPFYGATYIPPTDQHGRPGFPRILDRIQEVWSSDRSQVLEAGERIGSYLKEMASAVSPPQEVGQSHLDAAFGSFRSIYDSVNKGFGSAPKFPRPVVLNFLFRYYARTGNRQALDMSIETLRAMAMGGMHDHVGGGFHRYATDARWHVPHFEKMLYDQAQLAISYLEAYQVTREESFADVARDTFEYVLRDLSHPEGGFYSAEDAESAPDRDLPNHKEEGAFYVWTQEEIAGLLSPEETEIVTRHFGIESMGNIFEDPQGAFRGKNILHVVTPAADLARQLGRSEKKIAETIALARSTLFTARNKRLRCHLDDKVLTSWNGLMISAFARASQVLGEQRYLDAAERAARFILSHLVDAGSRELLHRYRDGEARFEAQLDDHALFIEALIDLYEASFNTDWLSSALFYSERMNKLFHDEKDNGYFDTTGQDPSILVRTKEWYDGAEPSGNAKAIMDLLRLSWLTDDDSLHLKARVTLKHFGEQLSKQPLATPQILAALDSSLSKPSQLIIAGPPGDSRTHSLLKVVHSRFIPNKVLLLADGARGQEFLSGFVPRIDDMRMVDETPTAYLCENFACQLPTNDPVILAKLLESASAPRP